MGDRRWSYEAVHLEPLKAELFLAFSVGATGAPTLLQYDYKRGIYTAAPLPGAANVYGTQAGARGVKSLVRNAVGQYQINLQQSHTRFLQGQVSFKVLGTAVYPNVIWPYPESTVRQPVSVVATGAASSVFTVAASPTGAVESGNVATITTTAPHGFLTGQLVQLTGISIAGPVVAGLSAYNGVYLITSVPTTTTFTVTNPENGLAGGGAGSAQVLAASPGPFLTMQFLNPTTSAAVELASGDLVAVQMVLGVGSGS